MNRRVASVQRKQARWLATVFDDYAASVEKHLPKWTFDRVGKEKLVRVMSALREAAAAYRDFGDYMETRAEHQKEDT